MSSERYTVPLVFIAPTVIAYGEFPGERDTSENRRAVCCLAGISGRSNHDDARGGRFHDRDAERIGVDGSVTGCPSERLIARILYCPCSR